jgi:hypothetical protein
MITRQVTVVSGPQALYDGHVTTVAVVGLVKEGNGLPDSFCAVEILGDKMPVVGQIIEVEHDSSRSIQLVYR